MTTSSDSIPLKVPILSSFNSDFRMCLWISEKTLCLLVDLDNTVDLGDKPETGEETDAPWNI